MKVLVEGEEMAKSVKCLLHKQADLRLTAQNSHKMRSCNRSTGEAHSGGFLGRGDELD